MVWTTDPYGLLILVPVAQSGAAISEFLTSPHLISHLNNVHVMHQCGLRHACQRGSRPGFCDAFYLSLPMEGSLLFYFSLVSGVRASRSRGVDCRPPEGPPRTGYYCEPICRARIDPLMLVPHAAGRLWKPTRFRGGFDDKERRNVSVFCNTY